MLTFFRRIKKSLLTSGSTRKYLLYAVGEVFLVMIGILLALQVNNWNEDRKNLLLEKEMLSELLQDLRLDTAYLNYQLERVDSISFSIEYLLTEPNSFYPPSGDLWTFASVYFVQNTKAIEAIKLNGKQIPRDDKLRNQIREHYHNAEFLLDLISLGDQDFLEFWSIPVQKSQFHYVLIQEPGKANFDYDIIPNDYLITKDSPEFRNFLILKKIRIRSWSLFYTEIVQSAVECMKSIEQYLAK